MKLCTVAVLTEGFSGNFGGGGGGGGGHSHSASAAPSVPFTFSPALIAVIICSCLFAMVLVIALFYLVTRLRFALFHCLTYHTTEIRPGWRLYREQAGRFFWLCIGVGLAFLAVFIVVAVPFAAGFYRLYRSTHAGAPMDYGLLFALILPLIPIFLLLVLMGVAADIILRDLMLPHIALENVSSRDAWHAVWSRVATEKGAFFLYAILRLFLPVVAIFALILVLALPMIVIFIVVGVSIAGFHSMAANAPGVLSVIAYILEAVVILAAVGFGILLAICIGGPLGIAMRNYALMFYGGRYAALGNILFAPAPAPPAPLDAPAV